MSTESGMTVITALIRPQMEGHVVSALHALSDFPGFSITEARGQGRGRGAGGEFVATELDLTYHRYLQLQIVCADDAAGKICGAIEGAAWTGRKGDGVIFTAAAKSFLRIREAGRPNEGVNDD
jgi:nitrogen regulatory protein P-II 1